MASAISLTALVANLGNYYQEHRDQIFTDALLGLEDTFSQNGISIEDGVADEVPLLGLSLGNILQPGAYTSTNFTNNVINLNNRKLKVKPVKADLLFYPQDFERKWITYNRTKKMTMKEFQDIPFWEYYIMLLVKKMKEELRYAAWTANTANVATDFTAIFDGWITKLRASVAAGEVSQSGTGNAITSVNVITELEAIADGMSDSNAAEVNYMYVSPQVYRWYVRGDTLSLGRNSAFDELGGRMSLGSLPDIYLRGTNVLIKAEPALTKTNTGLGSEAVILSIGNNLVFGTDTLSEINQMDFQKVDRSIKVFVDFKAGVDYHLANTTRKPIVVNAGAGW